jgi:hypothetical protein
MPDNKACGRDRDSVSIHTSKIYDACRAKDCIEDVRVYLTCESKAILARAINVKPKTAKILWTYVDIEPVPFNDGFYTVDAKFFYRVEADAFCTIGHPVEIEGFASFDKRVILFGSEGRARIFSSQMVPWTDNDKQLIPRTNLPKAVVEVVDPIVLAVKVVEEHDRFCGASDTGVLGELPDYICNCFRSELDRGPGGRRLYVTLGQFSLIKLERDAQLSLPAEFAIPEKECPATDEKDPCDLFAQFRFPVDEFFPPDCREERSHCGCR